MRFEALRREIEKTIVPKNEKRGLSQFNFSQSGTNSLANSRVSIENNVPKKNSEINQMKERKDEPQ